MVEPKSEHHPKQARSVKTEQALLDAFESLLREKNYADLTVSQIASAAGVTTGAIYRRFKDKQDLLRSAFRRFYERTRHEIGEGSPEFATAVSDRELITNLLRRTFRFTLDNIHIMKAANSLNDPESFELMIAARTLTAHWFAGLLKTSTLGEKDLETRCKFVLRIAVAAFRDTLLSGREAAQDQAAYLQTYRQEIDALISELTHIAVGYLVIQDRVE